MYNVEIKNIDYRYTYVYIGPPSFDRQFEVPKVTKTDPISTQQEVPPRADARDEGPQQDRAASPSAIWG